MTGPIDLHTHSALSDGTDGVDELVAAAKAAGLAVVALTDHDTTAGWDAFRAAGARLGLDTLVGIEVSTHLPEAGEAHPVHLLAYGCRPDPELEDLLETVREARRTRVPKMVAALADLGYPLTPSEVAAQSSAAVSTGRPHVADALVARGYVADRDEAFREFLYDGGPAYIPRYTPSTAGTIELVNRCGGVAVLAHPWGRGNRAVLTPPVVAALASRGLVGLEVHHVDHTADDVRVLEGLADDLGLISTGGSDYHGTGKTRNPLGARLTGPDQYRSIRTLIQERGGQP